MTISGRALINWSGPLSITCSTIGSVTRPAPARRAGSRTRCARTTSPRRPPPGRTGRSHPPAPAPRRLRRARSRSSDGLPRSQVHHGWDYLGMAKRSTRRSRLRTTRSGSRARARSTSQGRRGKEGHHQARARRVLPGGSRRGGEPAPRAARHDEAVRGRRRRRVFFQKRVPKTPPGGCRPRPSRSPAAVQRPSWSSTTPRTSRGR